MTKRTWPSTPGTALVVGAGLTLSAILTMGQTLLLPRVELKYPQLLKLQMLASGFLMCLPRCVEPAFLLRMRPLPMRFGVQMHITLRR